MKDSIASRCKEAHSNERHRKAKQSNALCRFYESVYRVERLYRNADNGTASKRIESKGKEPQRGNHLLARMISELKDSTHCKAPQSKATHGSAPQSIALKRNEIKRNAASLRLKQRLSESL